MAIAAVFNFSTHGNMIQPWQDGIMYISSGECMPCCVEIREIPIVQVQIRVRGTGFRGDPDPVSLESSQSIEVPGRM